MSPFWKISVFYFDLPKSWIWQTLGHFRNIFCKCHLHDASKKKSFGQKCFWIPCTGSKVPFWQFFNSGKMALLNLCMKFKNSFGQKTSFEALWKCHIQKIFITCSRVRQIQDLGQSKYKLRLFSKRTHGISKILFNLGSCEFLARLEGKIRKCLFFDGSLL